MLSPRQFEEWAHYAELEPFGMDEADFRAMTLNSTIAAVVGAKIDPFLFTLRAFIEKLHGDQADVETASMDEARLDEIFGLSARASSGDEKQLDQILQVH